MEDDKFKIVYNKALDILSRREHSKKELTEKLINKFDSHELINLVITKLIDNNLINDSRYVHSYIVARKRRGFGPKKITFELLKRGVEESLILNAINDEGGWKDSAKRAFLKKFKGGIEKDFKLANKQKNFLFNRGFSFEEIDSIFN